MKREFKFVKYQGCGNDFLILDETSGRKTSARTRSRLARQLTDRHFQVGADGLMFLERAEGFVCSMRLFEPAGNEAEMCGNGIRCIAAYMMERTGTEEVEILTRDGPKHISTVGKEYRVEMGQIRTKRRDLKPYITDRGAPGDSMMSMAFDVDGKTYRGSIVNSGEPHIIIRTRDLDSANMLAVGESMNANRKRFPKGVNVNFIQTTGRHSIKIRTYERGVYDETLACGTGATACAAAALMLGWVERGQVKVRTKGGLLRIDMDSDKRAFMTGPAQKVYSGTVSADV